jgi:hypothetical protein
VPDNKILPALNPGQREHGSRKGFANNEVDDEIPL